VVAVPLPLISAPGRHPQASGGRLENVIVEQLADTAGAKYIYWRAPGLKAFGTTANAVPRGQLAVGNTLYTVVGTKVYSSNSAGGAATALGGTLPGTTGVFMAANNAATPDIVIVAPGDGAFILSAGSVASYPDTDVGQPNSVVFHKGYFVFTYGDGKTRTSGINSTSINTTDVATAESKPDTLYRPIPLGNGQILLAGSSSIEVWGGQNDTGYPFSYIATIPRGIVGQYAIAGHEDGFGLGIFLVGDDYGVSTLNGYATVKISSPDVDRAIEGTADKTTIRVSVFIAGGHSYVVVQAPLWCWVYDVGVQTWHQRKSYSNTAIINYWRAAYPIKAFEKWLCTDLMTGNILQIDASTQDEVGTPLRMRIETGPLGAFPSPIRVNTIELYLTKGVGIATGVDPVQTKPEIELSISRNGGQDWSNPRVLAVGGQALTAGRVRAHQWGHVDVQGVRMRIDCSSNVPIGFMAADMLVDKLR
jgi:hypothetical protein